MYKILPQVFMEREELVLGRHFDTLAVAECLTRRTVTVLPSLQVVSQSTETLTPLHEIFLRI